MKKDDEQILIKKNNVRACEFAEPFIKFIYLQQKYIPLNRSIQHLKHIGYCYWRS